MESFTPFPTLENNSQGIVLQMVKQEPTGTVALPIAAPYLIHVAPVIDKSHTIERTSRVARSRSRSPLSRVCSGGTNVSPPNLNPQTSVCHNQLSTLMHPGSPMISSNSTNTTTTTTLLTTTQFNEPFRLTVIRSENGQYLCNYPGCGRVCRRQGDILRHQQSHLIRRVSYVCDQPGCGGIVAATDERCSPCGHVQMNPPVQYVAQCDFPGCGRQFTRHGSLKSHFRIHWKFLSLLNKTSENTESSQ